MKELTVQQFAQQQFKQFSVYDCQRSIPNLIDRI
jgi:hypothetical protein